MKRSHLVIFLPNGFVACGFLEELHSSLLITPITYALDCLIGHFVFMSHYNSLFQVGIIMYLPTADARQRKQITEEFFHYRRLAQTQLWDRYSAYEHWAKIEVIVRIFCS